MESDKENCCSTGSSPSPLGGKRETEVNMSMMRLTQIIKFCGNELDILIEKISPVVRRDVVAEDRPESPRKKFSAPLAMEIDNKVEALEHLADVINAISASIEL
jgi:hypothetical protein